MGEVGEGLGGVVVGQVVWRVGDGDYNHLYLVWRRVERNSNGACIRTYVYEPVRLIFLDSDKSNELRKRVCTLENPHPYKRRYDPDEGALPCPRVRHIGLKQLFAVGVVFGGSRWRECVRQVVFDQ